MCGVLVSAAIVQPAVASPTEPLSRAVIQPVAEEVVSDETALAVAEAAESGVNVEVDSLTTPTERVLALPDGTMQLEVSTVPVRTETSPMQSSNPRLDGRTLGL
jgi:hypothetical protein